MDKRNKPHVAIFFGGDAGTHDLSVQSGYFVSQYIPRSSLDVTPVKISSEGDWQVPLGSLPQQGGVRRMLDNLFRRVPLLSPAEGLARLLNRRVDAIFTLLRGKGGDDGTLHGLADTLNIPMVGSSIETCQLTNKKHLCLDKTGDIVHSPYFEFYRKNDDPQEAIEDVKATFVPPVFIKDAANEGSLGVELIEDEANLAQALKRRLANCDVIVQEKGQGQEINVTAYQDDRGEMAILPMTTIVPRRASFYDHMAKRREGRVDLHIVPGDDVYGAEEIVRDVYAELGCQGLASIDLIAGKHGITLLEVNTVPTFSAHTTLIRQLKAGSVEPGRLLENAVRGALK